MITKEQITRLKKAPDLVSSSEFGKTKAGSRLMATTYSSKMLGLSYREENQPQEPEAIEGGSRDERTETSDKAKRSK
jgi:hypothetical protein